MNRYYVEIVHNETGNVVKRLGPMTERKADRVEDGVNEKLNHDHFYTRIVEDTEWKPNK